LSEGTIWVIVWIVVCGAVSLLCLAIAMNEDRKFQKIIMTAGTIWWGLFTLGGLVMLACMLIPHH